MWKHIATAIEKVTPFFPLYLFQTKESLFKLNLHWHWQSHNSWLWLNNSLLHIINTSQCNPETICTFSTSKHPCNTLSTAKIQLCCSPSVGISKLKGCSHPIYAAHFLRTLKMILTSVTTLVQSVWLPTSPYHPFPHSLLRLCKMLLFETSSECLAMPVRQLCFHPYPHCCSNPIQSIPDS